MIACSPNGEVFSWGAGYYGRLGIGSSANSPTPVRVSRNFVRFFLKD